MCVMSFEHRVPCHDSLNSDVSVWLLTLIRLTHELLELLLRIEVGLGLEDTESGYTFSYQTTLGLRSLTSPSIFNELIAFGLLSYVHNQIRRGKYSGFSLTPCVGTDRKAGA